ncbi:MAG: OmpA family protein [Bacteroidota bacterium]
MHKFLIIFLFLIFSTVSSIFPQSDVTDAYHSPSGYSQGYTVPDEKAEEVPIFKVYKISGINSKGVDLGPVMYENKLVFASEREIDYVNYGENRFEKASYLAIQYSNINTVDDTFRYSSPRPFSNSINQLNHNGPICFSRNGNYAIFTRIEYYGKNKENIYRPRLFSAVKEDKKWKKIKSLNINKEGVSFGHPNLSADGEYLYFSSDMEGGYGGKDIYVCRKEGEEWSEPTNLGPEVNTIGNEYFPFIHEDGTLYFSSNGHSGFGGLDLFSALKVDGKWTEVSNLGSTINTEFDDFSIFFRNYPDTVLYPYMALEKGGFFSSNRPGSIGKDDIYGFNIKLLAPTEEGNILAGKFQFKQLSDEKPEGIKIHLVNEQGKIVYTTTTDKRGNFIFEKLPYDQNFTIKTDEQNPDLELLIFDENNEVTVQLTNNKEGKFVYKKLSYQQVGGLALLYTKDTNIETEGITKSFTGQLTGDKTDISGMKVLLVNNDGEIVSSAIADDKGNFVFENLPYDNNYIIKTEEYNPDVALLVFNDKNVIAELATNEKGEFIYVKLAYEAIHGLGLLDAVDTLGIIPDDIYGYQVKWAAPLIKGNTLSGRFKYKTITDKKPEGIRIHLVNEQGEIVYTSQTNKEGYFVFRNLPFNQSYIIKIDETDHELELSLLDDHNEVTVTLTNNKGGEFVYKKLTYQQVGGLALLYTIDTDLETEEITKSFTGQLTGDKTDISGMKVLLVNDDGEVVSSAITDEKGNFVFENLPFDNNYILKTEEYNPDVALLVLNDENVIAELATNEKGEFVYVKLAYEAIHGLGLLDAVDTLGIIPDDIFGYQVKWTAPLITGNTLSGRFKYQTITDNKPEAIRIYLVNEQGEIVHTTKTNKEGYFTFNNLPFDQSFIIKIDEPNQELELSLLNNYNEVTITLTNNKVGEFVYKKLSYQQVGGLSLLFTKDTDLETEKTTKSLTGQLTGDETDISGKKVLLVNDDGEIVDSAVTDDKGSFVFEKLPYDNNYILKTEEYNPDVELLIFNKENVIAELTTNEKGEFVYVKLAYETINNLGLLEEVDTSGLLKDDIYGYKVKWVVPAEKRSTLAGMFKYSIPTDKKPQGIKLYLINDKGEIVHTSITDEKGYFVFQNLPFDQNYIIKIDETDHELELSLLDDNNQVTVTLINDKGGKFVYKKLSYQQIAGLSFLYTIDTELETDAIPSGSGITREITKTLTGQLTGTYTKGLKVFLVGYDGLMVDTVVTDFMGCFVFKNLPYDKNYILKIEEYNREIELLVFNDENIVAKLTANEKGEFVNVKLAREAAGALAMLDANDTDFERGIEPSILDISKDNVAFISDADNVVFVFGLIKSEESGSLSMIEEVDYEDSELLIETETDIYLDTVQDVTPKPEPALVVEQIQDPAKHVFPSSEFEKISRIYFNFDSFNLTKTAKTILDSTAAILIGQSLLKLEVAAYTDIQGNDNYNRQLSKKRANSVIDYLISKGINTSRLISNSYGESNLAVKCTGCTVEQHKLNRRAEIKFHPMKPDTMTRLVPGIDEEKIERACKIYFNFDSYSLTKNAKSTLDSTAAILIAQPLIILEANAYTDTLGDDNYNLQLSKKRANSVIDYLISKGIDANRMTGNGNGEFNLAVKCTDCSIEKHQLNRRAVIKLSTPPRTSPLFGGRESHP